MVINTIFYLVVSGYQWRRPPRKDSTYKSVSHDFRLWRNEGTWQRIHVTLRVRARTPGHYKHPTSGCLDSQRGYNAPVFGAAGLRGGQIVMGRKRLLRVDPLGLGLGVVVIAASVSEPTGAGSARTCGRWGDDTYHGQRMARGVEHFHFRPQAIMRTEGQKGLLACRDAGGGAPLCVDCKTSSCVTSKKIMDG